MGHAHVKRIAWAALALSALAPNVWYLRRVAIINRLHEESISPSIPYSPAIDRLAGIHGARATNALLAIAKSLKPSAANRDAAIKALAKRRDPQVSLELTKMLRLGENLTTREAISEALQSPQP